VSIAYEVHRIIESSAYDYTGEDPCVEIIDATACKELDYICAYDNMNSQSCTKKHIVDVTDHWGLLATIKMLHDGKQFTCSDVLTTTWEKEIPMKLHGAEQRRLFRK
jgi:hypothetical protein